MTESEAIETLDMLFSDSTDCNYPFTEKFSEALKKAIKALEKQEKIKEAFEKWENDTSGIYGADDETTHLIGTLKKILRSDEE